MFLVFALLFSIVLLSACSGSADEAPIEQKSRVTVDFSTFQVEVEDMGGGSRAALADAASHLSFAVFDSKGTLVDKVIYQEKESGGGNFGKVQIELNSGTYTMVAVAHNGTKNAEIKSLYSVKLPGETFTDTFAEVQSLMVEPNRDCSFCMTLGRITSAFILNITDTPPDNAQAIQLVVNPNASVSTSLDINPTTGLALGSYRQVRTISITDISKDVPVYFINLSEDLKVDVQAIALDKSGMEIISHTIKNVPLVPNRKTIATGNFFVPKASGDFEIETTWGDDNNIEY